MSIPSAITYTNVSSSFDLDPASNRNFAVDLSSSLGVNVAIDSFKTQMLGQYWTLTGSFFTSTTLSVPAMSGSSITGFSKITANWYGKTLQFYMAGEGDPSGLPGLEPGTLIYGMLVLSATPSQADLLDILILAMKKTCFDPFDISGSGDTVFISGYPYAPGPSYNDRSYTANIIAGYQFNGPTKGGGWELTSWNTIEHSPVTVALRNKSTLNYLSIDATMNGHACAEILINKRNNFLSIVSPFMWNLFHRNDGTTWSSGDIYTSYDNYLICAPDKPPDQRNDLIAPLTYCAFVMIAPRTQLNIATTCSTALNSSFQDGGFSAFSNIDQGVSLLPLNSMQNAAGALTTTSDKYLQFQALMALAPGAGLPMVLVGDLWDMFVTTKYYPLDTLAFAENGKLVIAYRSQQAPCEATLWLATN